MKRILHLGEGLRHEATVSLARTDDLVRGLYRLRLEVTQATEFSCFVLFQIGADTYSYTGERKMALGNDRRVTLKTGRLVRLHPAITVSVKDDAAEFTLAGGLGYVPVTFTPHTGQRTPSVLPTGLTDLVSGRIRPDQQKR